MGNLKLFLYLHVNLNILSDEQYRSMREAVREAIKEMDGINN